MGTTIARLCESDINLAENGPLCTDESGDLAVWLALWKEYVVVMNMWRNIQRFAGLSRVAQQGMHRRSDPYLRFRLKGTRRYQSDSLVQSRSRSPGRSSSRHRSKRIVTAGSVGSRRSSLLASPIRDDRDSIARAEASSSSEPRRGLGHKHPVTVLASLQYTVMSRLFEREEVSQGCPHPEEGTKVPRPPANMSQLHQ